MAAAVTKTEETIGVIKKITWQWTSHTDGKVAVATAGAATDKTYNCEVVRLVTVPDGTDAPTADYDVSVYDEDNVDVLAGAGANRHGKYGTSFDGKFRCCRQR
jgi:hypothetical protein